jgi:uncharacterized protein (DUF305 family)
MFSQYLRLRVPTSASNIDVVRAAVLRLDRTIMSDRAFRAARHAYFRKMIAHHKAAQDMRGAFRI